MMRATPEQFSVPPQVETASCTMTVFSSHTKTIFSRHLNHSPNFAACNFNHFKGLNFECYTVTWSRDVQNEMEHVVGQI